MNSSGRFTPELRKLAHYNHNKCSVCGQALPRNFPAYAGYNAWSQEIYVGNCCQSQVVELASHIYWWWNDYPRPNRDTPIWRYMDFAKLVALLKDRAIFFARVDKLGDHFEGARGLASRKEEWEAYCIEWFRNAIVTAPNDGPPISEEEVMSQASKMYDDFERSGQQERISSFVSCWHCNHTESEAQWRLYAPSLATGIAVRTSFGRLDDALDQSFDVRGGFVQYVDFLNAFAGTYDRMFWKRSSLSHENEVRLVLTYPHGQAPDVFGVSVPVQAEAAIQEIVVSPFAPNWFLEVVRETTRRFGVGINVVKSGLMSDPFF